MGMLRYPGMLVDTAQGRRGTVLLTLTNGGRDLLERRRRLSVRGRVTNREGSWDVGGFRLTR